MRKGMENERRNGRDFAFPDFSKSKRHRSGARLPSIEDSRRTFSSLDRQTPIFPSLRRAFSLRRAGRPARQDEPVDLAHHVQFFGEGAECLRTTRRGGGGGEEKRGEVKESSKRKKTKIFFLLETHYFFLDLLLFNLLNSSSSTTPRLRESQTWPRPQKPPRPKLRPLRSSRPLLLRAAAAASRPRSPSPSSRRWRASTPMVKEKN